MTHKKWVQIFSLLFFGLIVVGYPPNQALAQELPKGMVVGDDQGIVAKKNGEYLMEVREVMPGKKWHTTISMVNMEKGIPYRLTMLISPPEVSGNLDLSKSIQMTLTYQNKQVYKGPISGVSSKLDLQRTPLDLGVFQAGDSRALEVDFSLSGEYTNQDFAVKNVMDNIWTFYAVTTTEPSSGSITDSLTPKQHGLFPSTGEAMKQGMIFLCLGLFIILIVLLIGKAKRKGNE
ncbi:hypothetical protein UAW_02115 [Enterococcus haemoperoxidus ATCC BAA-382]|uniref:Gram-positive cocci surface proteins LPxTG domain-containing protein n=1 Tax=Enterococcus haemoperoxidus ATCC BAA-382 TaxID=1158608 RepID=R2SQG2_9ENTE|nr:hypothetical protein [Enterococcus haemoperoxidus]EOH95036.1 hypothetical protein UAW_02115 [Enterococcus haemoperoxidus ATCC BAA-382]EOT60435.1 hypothetical protein I583_03081 [Enterococcus haemoperoxidus ATCC BAA-382]OJG54867.1 hypothetical protein RV06_GL002389 [Enterococcus haemoperoxidus]